MHGCTGASAVRVSALCTAPVHRRTAPHLANLSHPSHLAHLFFYQSTFSPMRMMRGPMIVDGSSNDDPEAQAMFDAASELPML